MIKSINDLLNAGEIARAYALVADLDSRSLRDLFLKVGFEYPSITIYTLLQRIMLTKGETASLHIVAHDILVHPLCHLDGAYSAALYHLRQAAMLQPDDISLLEGMLFFNYVPDKPLSDREARGIAKRILSRETNSRAALEFLQHSMENTQKSEI